MVLHEHNQTAVDKIKDAYTEKKNVIYVSGVGTGKSYVFIGLMEALGVKRILYVVPKYAIRENILKYEEYALLQDRTDFVSYNYFTTYEKGLKKCSKYDFVVIDEAHHLGSDLYGKVLLSVMEHCNAKFLGLTATPFRDADNVDVSTFFDERVDGLSNFEAIRRGLMPKFTYRICLPEKDLEQLRKEYDNTITVKLNYHDCAEVLYDIATTYERHKWICFFHSVHEIHRNLSMIQEVFSGYDIFILHSRLNNLEEVLEGARKSPKAVILSVNMLLEGVHLSGIDAIALFRNVTSLSVFQQMLGRVCSIGKSVSPLIADCSTSGPKLLAKLLKENGTGIQKRPHSKTETKPIMDIGLGAHEAWEGIDLLIERVATLKTKEERLLEHETNLQKAYEDYIRFKGNLSIDLETVDKSGKDYKKLKSCADIHGLEPYQLAEYVEERHHEFIYT